MMPAPRTLTTAQKVVLTAAFLPMLATGVAGGIGTYSNISRAYGSGTALGAVAAGEGATAVLALVLLGLTMLGQSSPWPVRAGLWALPAAASVMAAMAADGPALTVIYAITPMGMCVAAEGMAFLARRIVVHADGRDAEAEARAAAVVRELAYHRAVAANHPDEKARAKAERTAWKLARTVGAKDAALGGRLLDIQRDRLTTGADAALAEMFSTPAPGPVALAVEPVTPPVTPAVMAGVTPLPQRDGEPAGDTGVTGGCDAEDTQVSDTPEQDGPPEPEPVTLPVTPAVTPVTPPGAPSSDEVLWWPVEQAVTLDEVAAVAGVPTPQPGEPLSDEQLIVVLRHLRYSVDPPLSYRQAVAAFREAGYVGGEQRVRTAWGAVMSQEENTP
ncbi:hypothetical protein CUT44_03980 [Streptomyces carminius]|uniref:Conjugal transfer protein n=1 Tax=Streptomyces carminius TaxID=2665496 RepID=A0A2M8M652_9ACTN|nr:hypothetical protein [Streptomyces carminius]PJE99666.1 hypothetical protein CUT44_03980 [Streptomyces carminius]